VLNNKLEEVKLLLQMELTSFSQVTPKPWIFDPKPVDVSKQANR